MNRIDLISYLMNLVGIPYNKLIAMNEFELNAMYRYHKPSH